MTKLQIDWGDGAVSPVWDDDFRPFASFEPGGWNLPAWLHTAVGLGEAETTAALTHVYAHPGVYTITATMTEFDEAPGTAVSIDTVIIRVLSLPVARAGPTTARYSFDDPDLVLLGGRIEGGPTVVPEVGGTS